MEKKEKFINNRRLEWENIILLALIFIIAIKFITDSNNYSKMIAQKLKHSHLENRQWKHFHLANRIFLVENETH